MIIFNFVSLLICAIAINGHAEEFHAEPHIRQIPWLPNSIQHDDDNNAANEIPVLYNNGLDGISSTSAPPPSAPAEPPPISLPFVNRPLQVTLLAVIMSAAVFANGSVIANISRDSLKLRMVHFLLIRHVCIADCLGAIFVLPIPLVVFLKGEWGFNDNVCAAVSTTTASCWTMHLLAVALYRADRCLAVWLPTGRYPVFSTKKTNICLVIIWVGAILGSYAATQMFGHTFQPALALCIPNVPLVFFIIVFAGYCIGLVGLTTGYVLAFARRRRRKRKRENESKLYAELCNNAPFEPTPNDFIEDIESSGNIEKARRHRALSDQFSSSKASVFTPSSKLTHRRVFSEGGKNDVMNFTKASYCPTNLSSIVTRSNQMSYDSSSFPQNSSDTNINDYDRLTEDDDGSSEFSIRKLSHSVSFDGSTNSQSQYPVRKGYLFAQSKSFDQADISSTKQRNNNATMGNHFNSMTMYESVVRSNPVKEDGGSGDGIGVVGSEIIMSGSDKAIFSSNIVIRSSNTNKSFELDENVLPKRSTESNPTNIYQYNECALDNSVSDSSCATTDNRNISKKMVPLSLYSWPLDNTVSASNNNNERGGNNNNNFGIIMETRSSTCASSDSIGVVLDQRSIPLQSTTQFSVVAKLSVDPNAIEDAIDNIINVDSIDDGRPEGNNNTKKNVNFKGKRHPTESDNNVVHVRMVRKQRPRTRVKHFRPKPSKSGPAKRALASYAVSIGHLLLYLPAMFVVGLKGGSLPPGAALFCGVIVYCEFLVQPIALLLVSPRLRKEVIKTIYYLFGRR